MRPTFCLVGLALFLGCGPAHFSYPLYAPKSSPSGKALPLRVAIPYPEEGTSAPNRDVDIEPIVSSRCPQATFISPRLEISRGLLEELRAAGAFRVLHWAPESTDNYDLIVRLKLISGGRRFKSDICPLLMGPFEWELVVTDQRGRELARRRFTQAKVDVWAGSPVAQYRKDEQVFLAQVVPPILAAAEQVATTADLENVRALAFVDKRAPELKGLRNQISAGTNPAVEKGYLLQLAAVESARAVEEKTTEAHQKMNDEAWAAIQEKAGKELRELGEQVRKKLAESFQMLLSGIAGTGALHGVIPPALQRAATIAQEEFAHSVRTPSGAQSFLGAVPKSLLPGKAARYLSDAQFGLELAQSLTGTPPPPATEPAAAGCSKDTDCKGERICVARECVDPPGK